jgi:hypothetical protein
MKGDLTTGTAMRFSGGYFTADKGIPSINLPKNPDLKNSYN